MQRRHFLILSAAASIAAVVWPALAHNGDETIPGFDEALKAGGPVMIHITAPWCEVCQAQKPIVASLLASPDFKSMKKFDVDFDTQKEILARYRVQMQSTMIVYKGGKEVDRQTGQTDPAVIEALLREAL
ncbi:thioredoxin family protein [Mesorhizobium sp. B283B1A]|uniref:thioredoxin family protein n=1 Tax=Mesorhizobium TaxID=68287 RepID=UPI001CD06D2D|nr:MULTISPECIES: thioredoxin family protein [Mesorhizobium]MCA0046215.1 thioredoxin family protein [Mesorhizobium sp. B283B1A]UQS62862.1 thioredoxin family protein [Mesorhizobium opportunistum]